MKRADMYLAMLNAAYERQDFDEFGRLWEEIHRVSESLQVQSLSEDGTVEMLQGWRFDDGSAFVPTEVEKEN